MPTGNFGLVNEAYVVARRGFPREVFDFWWQYVKTEKPKISI